MQGPASLQAQGFAEGCSCSSDTWQCCREAGKAPEKEKNTDAEKKGEKKKRTDELSDEGGIKPRERGGCKLQKGSARSQPPPKTTGEATKGKCHCTRTLKCAVRHKLGKSSRFFPLFLEHLREEEEAHAGAGSSLTFPLTLPQVLTNYTQGQTFLQPREQEAEEPAQQARETGMDLKLCPSHRLMP